MIHPCLNCGKPIECERQITCCGVFQDARKMAAGREEQELCDWYRNDVYQDWSEADWADACNPNEGSK